MALVRHSDLLVQVTTQQNKSLSIVKININYTDLSHSPQPTKPEATEDQPTTELSKAYMKFQPDFLQLLL